MSWNVNLVLLPDVDVASLGPVGPVLSFDEAVSGFGAHGASWGAGVVLLDPFVQAKDLAVRSGTQLFSVMLGGTADVYAIEAVGAVARLRVLVAGEVVEDRGEPLAQESVLGEHEFAEDAHIALFERLCGLPSGQSLHDLAFHALDGV